MITDIRWVSKGDCFYLEACDGHSWFPVKADGGVIPAIAWAVTDELTDDEPKESVNE